MTKNFAGPSFELRVLTWIAPRGERGSRKGLYTPDTTTEDLNPQLFVVMARSPDRAIFMTEGLLQWLEQHPEGPAVD